MAEKAVAPLLQATAGAVSSATANAIILPLDFLGTRLQTTSHRRGAKRPSLLAVIRRILATEGPLAFYRGILPDTFSTLLSNFIYFYVQAFLKKLLSKPSILSKPTKGPTKQRTFAPAEELAIGMFAGMVSRFFTTPLSSITVRKQTAAKAAKKGGEGGGTETPMDSAASTPMMTPQASSTGLDYQQGPGRLESDGKLGVQGQGQSRGSNGNIGGAAAQGGDDDDSDEEEDWYEPSALDVVKEIYADKGLRGLWSGYQAACILTINPAITFYLFEAFKRAFIPRASREKPSPLQTFLTSASASAIASALVYPLILTKTRLQWKSPSGRRVYRSATDVVRKTIRRHGVTGLYQGLETQMLKGFLNVGLTMVMKQRVEQGVIELAKKR